MVVADLILDAEGPDLLVVNVVVHAGVVLELSEVVHALLAPFVFETKDVALVILSLGPHHSMGVALSGVELEAVRKVAEDMDGVVLADGEDFAAQFLVTVAYLQFPAIEILSIEQRSETVLA